MLPIKATLNYSPPFDATSYIKRGYTNSRESQSASRRRNLRVRDLSRVRRRDVRTNTIEKTAHRLRELAITKTQSFILLCLFHSFELLCSGQAPYGATWSICCCPRPRRLSSLALTNAAHKTSAATFPVFSSGLSAPRRGDETSFCRLREE